MSDTDLNRLWLQLERRRMRREQSTSEQMAQAWADLIAAFGEADMAGATTLDLPEEPGNKNCEDTQPGPLVHFP